MSSLEVSFKPAQDHDAVYLAENIRDSDRQESIAAHMLMPLEALRYSLARSDLSYTVFFDGRPAVIFGVSRPHMLSKEGIIWLAGTCEIEKNPKRFLRKSCDVLSVIEQGYSRLYNYVDARNTKTVSWLKWLGFTLEEPRPYGALGRPFHYFYKEPSNVLRT